MTDVDLDALLHAWLAARSVARGLPAPVADRGGYRVDTGGTVEIKRWVFARVGTGLVDLGRAIDAPGYVLKACTTNEALRAVLPDRWELAPPTCFMIDSGSSAEPPLAPGYAMEIVRNAAVTRVIVRGEDGETAASGFGAETAAAFVCDRIETAAGHRRKGLGRAVMAALDRSRRARTLPALLVATEEGHALYSALGWQTIAPYATASIGDGRAAGTEEHR